MQALTRARGCGQALEEAEMVTKGEAGLHRLVRLERPLLDLLAANDASVRDAAYRLVSAGPISMSVVQGLGLALVSWSFWRS